MEKFEITILGCGCALPTTRHYNAAQVINIHDKLFLVDCGEGTQIQFRKNKFNFNRLGHIFISHLHGDHCFGLIGLISTFNLLGRTAQLHIHAPAPIENLFKEQLDFFCPELNYKVEFHEINTTEHRIIFEDRTVEVWSLPLNHRISCTGFLFKEKPLKRHINAEMVKFYKIPHYMLNPIKEGQDFISEEGDIIPNERLTKAANPSRSYAYCSDTSYIPALSNLIKNVDVLFHEATFLKDREGLAAKTFHSTAMQAASIAKSSNAKKLIIGHYSARYKNEEEFLEEAKEIFPETILAAENGTIKI